MAQIDLRRAGTHATAIGREPKLPDELNLALSAEPEPVSCCSTSPIEVRPVRSMSPRVNVWIGTWPSTSARLMRVPVTSTASRLVVDCAAAPNGARAVTHSATATASGR
ncbi:hypothetical protein VM57_16755 [Stenotrophomonas maltophilia]|uniref:Uncharacterized protein n=1 Tax=Stenotrophomonas maltophilia TaxID=40324 RepID=A0A0F5ZMK8_STEMA|nr:hypothetical protein VM57_16755 [Stenotrophomonas maltophilia]